MNRHEYRQHIVAVLYQHLLLSKNIDECMYLYSDRPFDEFETVILKNVEDNEEKYIEKISGLLVDWKFNRLNLVDQAILLSAVAELNLKLNDKAVIIDEAVLLAKEFSDETSYRYINGVLDRYELD